MSLDIADFENWPIQPVESAVRSKLTNIIFPKHDRYDNENQSHL